MKGLQCLSFVLIIFFTIRMIFENSFIIYGIDYIIFITSYIFLIKGKHL